MLLDKNKRYIWLFLSILSVMVVVARALRVADGSDRWWKLVAAAVISIIMVTQTIRCFSKRDDRR